MKQANIFFYLIAILLIALGISMVVGYQRIIDKEEFLEVAFIDLEDSIERKTELVPSFLSSVKEEYEIDNALIESIKESRKNLKNASKVKEKSQMNEELSDYLNELWKNKSGDEKEISEKMIQFAYDFHQCEEKIQEKSEAYNQCVKEYNHIIKTFPNTFISSFFNFEEEDYFINDGRLSLDVKTQESASEESLN